MSDLTGFRDHARRMVTATHRSDCPSHRPAPIRRSRDAVTVDLTVCTGCVTPDDRDLWARLADETDAYLTRHQDTPLEGTA